MKIFKKNDILGILHELGILISTIGLIMIMPSFIAIYFNEPFYYFLYPSIFFIIFGFLLNRVTKPISIKLKHAMVISALAWLTASFIGAIPFYFGIPYFGYIDGVFESMSAWTTTGFTIINDVEVLPKSIQIWRSLEQWIGGVGVLAMVISILSKAGASAYYRAEAREEKIMPSTLGTIKKIWHIYLLYTILGICLLYLSGLDLWTTLNVILCGISTGGMSISNAGFPYNNFAKIIIIAIMYLGGVVSFSVHHNVLTGRKVNDIQTKISIPILFFSAFVISITSGVDPLDSLFTVVSAMTSTGFLTTSTSNLTNISIALLIFIMAVGGATGTTTGGIKLVRLYIMIKGFYYRLKEAVSPSNSIISKKIGNNILEDSLILDAFLISFGYMLHYIFSALSLIALGYDPYLSIFEAVSLVANIGLSVGIVSHSMHPIAKILGIFSMWVGRLEIIPIYVLIILPLYMRLKSVKKDKNFKEIESYK
ncbi:cation transporter [Methanococcus vannielii SB]|uniref:Cation transporter n=1 Tax=Methanococcus vannielii (strain ATCC 35089 / DSM 1224 / JCM 13029 / OCM 148 / SB) TaxID=406327 RepID=A6UQ75_METVS|nr:TrkH family potassium uptake protein [Methanococcus vannielii]ABR54647.1 cation transporter [Methanococcus vannielii SB]